MASRLYRTPRLLYGQSDHRLQHLGISTLGIPPLAVLIALYVTGLLLLDARPTHTRVPRLLPGRCHDALNRLLRTMPISTRALVRLLSAFVKRLDQVGSLVLDDVIVEKAYAKRLPWAGWTYSVAKKRKVYGLHIVVLLRCSLDGQWRIPVGFRFWRPKRSWARHRYRTKLEVASELVTEVVVARLPISFIVFDTHSTASWFTKRLARLGLTWRGTLDPKTHVLWRGSKLAVREVAPRLRLTWRKQLGLRTVRLRVVAPTYGELTLVVV